MKYFGSWRQYTGKQENIALEIKPTIRLFCFSFHNRHWRDLLVKKQMKRALHIFKFSRCANMKALIKNVLGKIHLPILKDFDKLIQFNKH